MELRADQYKKTEVGFIPNDWDVKPLAECCSKITDGTHDTPKQVKTGVPFLTAIHVKENNIDFKGCYYLPEEVHRIIYNRCNPQKDDVLMVNIGAGVATTALVNVDYEFSLKNVALLKPDNEILIGAFLNYWQIHSKSRIINSISTGGAQPFLSLNQIGNLRIVLPTTTEQTAIATALSDADALITNLEKLITKKRNIKQAAMQKLLQPKEGWEVKKLGDVCQIFKGKGISKSQISESGKYECILYGELFTNYKEVITKVVSKTNVEESIFSKVGDILYPGSTTTTGIDLAKASAIMNDNVLLGGDIVVLRQSNYKYNPIFLSYFLNEIKKFEIAQTTKGITIHHLYGRDLAGINAEFPSIQEQERIATILTDMDAEIDALKIKLEKYRDVKLGMMQNLLTGKIRL